MTATQTTAPKFRTNGVANWFRSTVGFEGRTSLPDAEKALDPAEFFYDGDMLSTSGFDRPAFGAVTIPTDTERASVRGPYTVCKSISELNEVASAAGSTGVMDFGDYEVESSAIKQDSRTAAPADVARLRAA